MSKGNRAAAEALILKWVAKIDPSGVNAKMYKNDIFPNLSDAQFDAWMKKIEKGSEYLFINIPNMTGKAVNVKNNLKVAKEMGVKLFQKITQTDVVTGKRYTGTREYLIIDLPVRRQIQMITNKISIQAAGAKRDDLTGQIAGTSKNKGASISYPETLVLYSQGLDNTIVELLKVRGGDVKASRVIHEDINNQGAATLASVDDLPTRAKSSDTLSTYLKAMHLDNNL